MQHFFLICIALLLVNPMVAQEADTTKNWEAGAVTNLTFSQTSLTNWAAGGENSYSLTALADAFLTYKTEQQSWENTFTIGYGFQKTGERNSRKTDDKLVLNSKYGYQAINQWFYSGMLEFKTQMDQGYEYDDDAGTQTFISDAMAPAYLQASLGMEYKPDEHFALLISPLTGKTTFVMDDTLAARGAFGVDEGENIRHEFGGFVKIAYKNEIFTNVVFSSQLGLFSNYMEQAENIDVNWETLIALKVNEFLSANISTHLIYDDDVHVTDADGNTGPRIQFKEVFGLGISYNF